MHVKAEESENYFYEKSVGNRIPRIDGLKKVLGTEIFGADYWPKDSLLIKIIRSPYHRAKFEFGDLNKWKKQNYGLEIILTSKDIPGENKFGVIPNFADQPALAVSEAKFKGEIIWDENKPDGTYRKLLSIRRMKELGWTAKISLNDGISKTFSQIITELKK